MELPVSLTVHTNTASFVETLRESFNTREPIPFCVVAYRGGTTFDLRQVVYPCKPAWTGEGLPPVGTVCEWWDDDSGAWVRVEVRYLSEFTALLLFQNGPGDCEGACSPADCQFRPIRTPEQIAKIERSKACDEMFGVMTSVEREGNRSDMAEALYDAGYRKQVQK